MISKGRYFALALLCASFVGQVAAKTVIVDLKEVLGDIQDKFQTEQQAASTRFQKEAGDLAKQIQDLEAKTNDVKDKEAHQKKIDELKKKMEAKGQMIQAEMIAAQQKAQAEAEGRIKKIEGIRKSNGWSVVIPKEAALAFDPSLDVTETVKKAVAPAKKK